MPEKYKRAVRDMMRKGYSEQSAHAIATSKNIGHVKEARKRERRHKKKH